MISRFAGGALLFACASEPHPPVRFEDAAAGSGIDFDHVKGSSGDYFLIETMAAGGAFADFDGDGHLDIYLVNGFDLGGIPFRLTNVESRVGSTWWTRGAMETRGSAPADPDSYAVQLAPAAAGAEAGADVMYRNDRDGTFTDVTAAAGAAGRGYGFGCAVADYDNDGDQDLYVTNYGDNAMYRNAGDGSFADATAEANVAAPQWSTSAAFFDYDNDGS
ncbi:MAG: VCBS repeat-containing protein, partial [Gemmatimonadetes bacterium]|nr:VCBS repeat-containing protein [Gemmatimonadota bacterium]